MTQRQTTFLMAGIVLATLIMMAVLLWPSGDAAPKPDPAPPAPIANSGSPVPPPVVVEPETPPIAIDPVNPNRVYRQDFKATPGDEWNLKMTGVTNKGARPHLGPFFPDVKPALTLKGLPPHKLVRVSFDLFLFNSWDGSHPTWGPGLFDVSVGGEDGRSLIHSTFSNCGFFNDNNMQTFPDTYPSRPYPAWTLATENQTLGTVQDWGGPGRTFDASGAYRMVLTFPHDASAVSFEFRSVLPDNPNKSYGITNLEVEAFPELAKFTAAQFDTLWADLGRGDPVAFHKARWDLISAGDAAVEVIAAKWQDIKVPANIPPDPLPPNAKTIPYPPTNEETHLQRARHVLEAIHTPAALALREKIPAFDPSKSPAAPTPVRGPVRLPPPPPARGVPPTTAPGRGDRP